MTTPETRAPVVAPRPKGQPIPKPIRAPRPPKIHVPKPIIAKR